MKQTVENIWTEEREREHLLKKVKKHLNERERKPFENIWKHLNCGGRELSISLEHLSKTFANHLYGGEKKHILKTFANHLNGRERKHLKTFKRFAKHLNERERAWKVVAPVSQVSWIAAKILWIAFASYHWVLGSSYMRYVAWDLGERENTYLILKSFELHSLPIIGSSVHHIWDM